MTSNSRTNYYNFPPPHYFSPPPPPAAKPPPPPPPPPPHVNPPPPPPPHKRSPPPPPPPPPPHVNPPPPHIRPPPPPHVLPPPPSPSPSPDNHPTVIVIVFVSFGCLFFLAFLSVALCCFLKKRKKKKMVQETDIIKVDEHLNVKETIVPGPHGEQAVVLLVDDDIHTQERIKKNEIVGQGPHFHGIKSAVRGIMSNSAIGKKKKEKKVQETQVAVKVDEHSKVKEEVIAGPHGAKAVLLSKEDAIHIQEEIRKNEKMGKGLHGKSALLKGEDSSISHHRSGHKA